MFTPFPLSTFCFVTLLVFLMKPFINYFVFSCFTGVLITLLKVLTFWPISKLYPLILFLRMIFFYTFLDLSLTVSDYIIATMFLGQ